MWRHVKRGFQRNFKRSLCPETPDASLKDGKKGPYIQIRETRNYHHDCCIKKLLPTVFQKLNYFVLKDADEGHNHKQNQEKTSRNICHHRFFEAFGWSGALVFGWVISKQLWFKQSWPQDRDSRKQRIRPTYDHSFIELLARIVNTQPPVASILPQIQTTPVAVTKSKGDTGTDLQSNTSLDDEFEAAAEELLKIHRKTTGEALNRRGIACLSKSTGSEAVAYFKRSSELKYPPASFNMGQCCELGIGTKQDFKQAAEWYKIASEQGHATAMYNLGVFYAHGWGGLPADISIAKRFLIKAASLGQPDAKAALEKESKIALELLSKTDSAQIPILNDSGSKSSELNFFVNNIKNGLTEDIFQKGFGPENIWDSQINKPISVAF